MNPFDLKRLLLERHAQHVVLIHFPIALFVSGVLLDAAAQWKRKAALAFAAYCNLLLAAVGTLPTVATGLLAWQWALEGQKLKGILRLHLVFGLASTLVICVVWGIHFWVRRSDQRTLPLWRFVLEGAGVLLLGLTGHLGGFLSGVNS